MNTREAKIEKAAEFLRESDSADRATVIELLKEDGLSGNEIMEALSKAVTGGTA